MNSFLKMHIKKQKSNYILVVVAILFSLYFSTINTCQTYVDLVDKNYNSLKSELYYHRLFMKKLTQSANLPINRQLLVQDILLKLNSKTVSAQEISSLITTWASIFGDFIKTSKNSETYDIQSMSFALNRLLSLGLHYNLNLIEYKNFSMTFLSQLLCKQTNISNIYVLLNNDLFNDKNFIIVP